MYNVMRSQRSAFCSHKYAATVVLSAVGLLSLCQRGCSNGERIAVSREMALRSWSEIPSDPRVL